MPPDHELSAEEQAAEASAAIAAGYAKIKQQSAEPEPPETPAVSAEGEVANSDHPAQKGKESPKEGQSPASPAPAADPWEGVAPVIRQTLERIDATSRHIGPALRRLKSAEDRIESIAKTSTEAAKAAESAGARAPSQAQVMAATTSAKWKQLQEDFPEWAEAIDERLSGLSVSVPQAAAVDVDGIHRQIEQAKADARREAREMARLDAQFEDWEETIATEDFLTWSITGGPSREEFARHSELQASAPQEAAQLKASFATRFPQWYAEKGALIYSDSAKDAIKMLRAYHERDKSKDAPPSAETAPRKSNTQRLAANVAPKQAARSGPTVLPDEAGLAVGYNRIKAKRSA